MNRIIITIAFLLSIILLFGSCTTPQYIHDKGSNERQKKLIKRHSGNIFSDIGLLLSSIFIMAAVEVDREFIFDDQEFKKLKLINPTKDTIYVNMLTDVYWDEENFCDFMDIRLPPNQRCKMLVPVNANYNVYFSNTPEPEDDEMLEINTDEFNKLKLYPGMTKINDPKLNQ